MYFNKAFSISKLLPPILAALLISFTFSGCGKATTLELSGTIESTQIDANSEVAGKIISLEKDEGSVVGKDDILAIVDSSIQNLSVKQQEALVKIKQARLDDLKAGTRTEQLQQADAAVKAAKANLDALKAGTRPEQIQQSKAAVETAKAGVKTAEISYSYWLDKYNKIKSLYNSNKVSENDLSDAKFKVDTAVQQLETAKEQYKSAQYQLQLLEKGATSQSIIAAQANYEQALAQLDLLKNGATSQAIIAAEADLDQSKAALEQANLVLSKYRIKSPIDGTLLLRNINIGDMVNIGSGVGTVSDLSNLWVKVYIPQKNLGSVTLGQEVILKSAALKGTGIKGKITYISSEAEFTPKNTETSEAKENTVFKIKIKILDNIEKLKPGMTVEASIPLS